MTNSEPNPRLNVPIRLVPQPAGDFAVAGAGGTHTPNAHGNAIIAGVEPQSAGAAAVAAVSQLQNLDTPAGALSADAPASVTASGDLTLSVSHAAPQAGELSVTPAKITALDGTTGANLNLGTPKFTY